MVNANNYHLIGVISQKIVGQKLIFGAWMWERVVGRWMLSQKSYEASFLFSHKKTLGGAPFFFPFLAAPSPPHCSRPLPSPLLPPPSKSPPRSKDREGKEQVGLKRKRGPRRCSIPISSCRFSWGNPR
jgi:hypothetical protein